jgi:hypothetical protein
MAGWVAEDVAAAEKLSAPNRNRQKFFEFTAWWAGEGQGPKIFLLWR